MPMQKFCSSTEIINDRCKRVLTNEQLRVIYVGTFSIQKGMYDMVYIVKKLCKTKKFKFRFVGPVEQSAKSLKSQISNMAEFIPKQPQAKLPELYAWADIFVFPTIQDGYALVLAQAQAAALPFICTTNCAGLDIVAEGKIGWILPIRSPDDFIERLLWVEKHREEYVQVIKNASDKIYNKSNYRSWSNVAYDLISVMSHLKKDRRCA